MKDKSDRTAASRRFLSSLPLFEGLEGPELLELEDHSTTFFLKTGEHLFQPGDMIDSLYLVVCGALHLVGSLGSRQHPARLVPGDLFGEAALRFHMPSSTVVVAGEPSEVISIPVSTLDALLEGRPAVRQRITAEASLHLLRLHLASLPMFAELDDSLLWYLACNSEFVAVKRGEMLMREGDRADCFFIVASGSLEVIGEERGGTEHTTDILRDGACVGEMALLLNEPRSANVRAWRDSLLIRVSGQCFEEVFHKNPQVTLWLARTLSTRLKRTTLTPHQTVPIKTIAIVPWCPESGFAAFCERLQRAFQSTGNSFTLLSASVMREETGGAHGNLDLGPDRYSAWLAAKEAVHQYVLCRCDGEMSEWTRRSIQQADLVLFACMPGGGSPPGDAMAEVEAARTSGARMELVLLRDSQVSPSGTSPWLEMAAFTGHHHVAMQSDTDFQRLVRRLTGSAWGLVLGGGGARGLAHIGVIHAMRESGHPIDMIGGTSMGAIIAAQCAMGWSSDEILAATRRAYAQDSGPWDLTLPLVSLRTGRGTIKTLKEMFGERCIEDLPLSYFCVSCNLTRAEVVIHDRGPLWLGTRVSCSVPGLLPAVPYRGDLLVDGGLLDNLPVDTMRKRLGGSVVAADVSVAVDLAVKGQLGAKASWSGFSQLFRKLTNRPRPANIVNVLMRTAEVSSVRDSKISGSPADLYLHLPVDDISMTDFQKIDRIVAIGYEFTLRRLEEWKNQRGKDPGPAAG